MPPQPTKLHALEHDPSLAMLSIYLKKVTRLAWHAQQTPAGFYKVSYKRKESSKKKRGRKHVVFADTPKVLLPKKTRTKNKTKLKQMQLLGGGITKCGPAKAGGKLYSQSAPRHGLLPAATTSPTTSGDIPVVYSCPAVACLLLVSSKYRPASCSKPGRHIYNTAHC